MNGVSPVGVGWVVPADNDMRVAICDADGGAVLYSAVLGKTGGNRSVH